MRAVTVSRSAGFSLVELMVTIAIVGVLAAIAIPSYSSYIKRGNRTDAINTLTQYSQALQRCYSQNFTYTPAATCGAMTAGPTTTPGGYYTVLINPLTATSYTITATPVKSPQTSDSPCAIFTLSSAGTHSSTSSGGGNTTLTCWGTN